jgi:NitT/TauT family transport system substrate-binding protein
MRRLSILLNGGLHGPHAGFVLAEQDGHLAREGLAVEWRAGRGAGAAIEDMQGCDAAYGDLVALIARLGREAPWRGPRAVFVAFVETPLTIAVARDGPVSAPRDLEGRRVSGHGRDAALIAFPAFARAAAFDPGRVTILPDPAPLAAQVRAMLEDGAAEGVFGFVNTILAGLDAAGRDDLAARLRFLRYADHAPDMAGNALVVAPSLLEEPDTIRALLRALDGGFRAAMAEPERGVAAVAARAPIHLAAETRRWRRTIAAEMAHPDAARFGLGGMDPDRVGRAAALVAAALGLPRVPAAAEIFDPGFLPDWRGGAGPGMVRPSRQERPMPGIIDAKLAELGITVPEAAAPLANYIGYNIVGKLVVVSGQLPIAGGKVAQTGKVGAGVSIEQGAAAARICFVNLLAQLKAATGGDLDRVKRVVRLGGFIASPPDFTQHALVMNGASDLAVAVFGEKGKHARTTIGVPALPADAAVEVEGMFELE